MTDDPETVFEDLTAAMGAPPLSAEEKAAVLRLAKAVADASERRFAPLTCYAAGLVIGIVGRPADAAHADHRPRASAAGLTPRAHTAS